MYSTSIRKYERIKIGLFVKQGVPHNVSLATHAYHCSVQFFTFGNDLGATKKNQVRPKVAKCCCPRPISKFPKFDWSESRPSLAPKSKLHRSLRGEIQRSFDLMNASKHFVESKIRNYCESSN